ncbi:hypothetical protein ACIGXM_25530 [Kitasatospora sp. NPDC052896]|uniref:hypothetical protein n=1 Tax=Kitasatospora sp. NPDC052896 TaxID=3364061 RepID=UPI0037C8E73F
MSRITRLFAAAAVATVLSTVAFASTGIGWDSTAAPVASAAPVVSPVAGNGIGWD